VHLHVLREAARNHAKFSNALFEAGIEDDTLAGLTVRQRVGKRIQAEKLSEFYTLGTILGDRYADSPVVQSDADAPTGPRDFLNYLPSSAPGGRAPHAWLHDGSSLFDHFGPCFTLLALPGAPEAAVQAAVHAASRQSMPLKILQPDNPAVASLYQCRLTLIRPDQHIAWAGDAWPAAGAQDVFSMVTGHVPAPAFQSTPETTPEKETVHESGS
jgi:hypothetical protein